MRMSYADFDSSTHNITLQYVDTSASSAFGGAASTGDTVIAISLYGSSVLAPLSAQHASMDTWGNPKVPLLQGLSVKSEDGWLAVPSQPSYSSLVGIPVSGLNDDGSNSSFTVSSFYWTFDCPPLANVTLDELTAMMEASPMTNVTYQTLRMGVIPPTSDANGYVFFASTQYKDTATSMSTQTAAWPQLSSNRTFHAQAWIVPWTGFAPRPQIPIMCGHTMA